jgi:hypothetical protein
VEITMDEMLEKFTTPESCEQFALNVEARSPERARAARRKAVELRAKAHGAESDVEREALQAVHAYERALFMTHGKNIRASRTWPMIERYGIIGAVERIVSRPADSAGYAALVRMGMQDMAFEAVVLRHPKGFSSTAVERSAERLRVWSDAAPS